MEGASTDNDDYGTLDFVHFILLFVTFMTLFSQLERQGYIITQTFWLPTAVEIIGAMAFSTLMAGFPVAFKVRKEYR